MNITTGEVMAVNTRVELGLARWTRIWAQNFSITYSFWEMGVETPQKGIFGHFWITLSTKSRVLEPSKMSQIGACHFPFRPQ